MAEPVSSRPPSGAAQFTTTHWSVVLTAADSNSTQALRALELLCRAYWYPLYAFVRRQGRDEEAAKDSTQGFFARLLEKDYLAQADPGRGKFRSFLLAAFKHFLADEWDRERAQKRGGGYEIVSLQDPEERYRMEPLDESSPEKIYERRWAFTVLEQAAQLLEKEYAAAGRRELFAVLTQLQSTAGEGESYSAAAARLGMAENTLKSHGYRLRQRNRELLREVIAETVATPADVDEEVRYLIAVVSES